MSKIKFDLGVILSLAVYFVLSAFTIVKNDLGFDKFLYSVIILKYIIFFVLASNILESNIKSVDLIIKISLFFITGIILLEAFNPLGIGDTLNGFFSHRNQKEFQVKNSHRLIGTMINPNNNGVLLLCLTGYFLSSYYYLRKKTDILYIGLCIILIIVAQSRTTLVALGLMGLIFITQNKFNKTIIISSFLVILFLGVTIYFLKMNYLKELFTHNPMDIPEFRGRFPAWSYMIEVWKKNPFFGVGPLADKMGNFRNAPDSEYIYVLASNGIIGLISYLAVLILPVVILWKRRKNSLHALLGILLPVGFLIIAVTNFTILTVRIGVIYFILLGIPFSVLLNDANPYKKFKLAISFFDIFKKRK